MLTFRVMHVVYVDDGDDDWGGSGGGNFSGGTGTYTVETPGGGPTTSPNTGPLDAVEIDQYNVLVEELQLGVSQKFWLKGKNSLVGQIHDFLAAEVFSEEAKDFAKEAIEVIIDGGEADFDNEILKDSSFVGTKADCVLDKLISTGNNIFRETSEAFTDNKSKFRLRFSMYNDTSDSADARTPLPDANGVISINFNIPVVEGSNYIDYASIILHETIHAELHRIKLSGNSGPNPLPPDSYKWFVDMWNYYEGINSDPNYIAASSEHYLMANRYIDNIASGLKQFNNNRYDIQNYKYSAWIGLEDEGKAAGYITNNELDQLAALKAVVTQNLDTNVCN